MKNKLIAFLLGIVAVCFAVPGCSGPSVKGYEKDQVLSTVNNESQPKWADETRPFRVEDGRVMSVGLTQIKGDERPEAGARIAENNARANIAKAIENRMEFIFQNAEEGLTYDRNAAKFIGAEVSSLTSHSMKAEGMWWVRFAQSDDDGSRKIRYKIYTLVTLPEDDFKTAVRQAIAKASGEKKLSPGFQKQVDKQWDRFVEGPVTPAVGQE